MLYRSVPLQTFTIAGISVRTTNQNNQSAADIGMLWKRFYEEGILARIPDKLSEDLYCVYTDYESNDKGWYRTVLGCRVTASRQLPDSLTTVEVPGGNYLEFTSSGKLPESIMQTWNFIWQADFNRLFTADFDQYPAGGPNQPVLTYLSVG